MNFINIIKIVDNGLTYKIKWEEEDGSHIANIGEYTKECEGIAEARKFIREHNDDYIKLVWEYQE